MFHRQALMPAAPSSPTECMLSLPHTFWRKSTICWNRSCDVLWRKSLDNYSFLHWVICQHKFKFIKIKTDESRLGCYTMLLHHVIKLTAWPWRGTHCNPYKYLYLLMFTSWPRRLGSSATQVWQPKILEDQTLLIPAFIFCHLNHT
jgi:hypothetical protein